MCRWYLRLKKIIVWIFQMPYSKSINSMTSSCSLWKEYSGQFLSLISTTFDVIGYNALGGQDPSSSRERI